ncbi:unnamed protein product [Rotaria magnacalcarata]|uniref:Clathrin/coatomer adaptor adaptin-like N-terminal domain-containing protein n=1 Tax=Rotaria magnacalcarata TaxID=392030 RepID=A0A816GMR2_9BILA|nr:unnamed protein product [Rotaria magnacalcarata]CAF4702045.1 unnamed protein product [Rotaria magnacalcarata]CAF5014712.1 unnamed protein product [Rotaria magnacalcarata]
MTFLANMLREEGGYEYKKAIVNTIISIVEENPEAKEAGLTHLCEFIEDCEHKSLATAVVNALAKFGAASEELLPNILLLLHRTTLDQDDEVRDRATFYYQLLKHSDKALNSANIFNSMNVSLSALECLLHRYTMESTTKPFDGRSVPIQTFHVEQTRASMLTFIFFVFI